jgi:glycerophosphoryl diester phosphodiesterase
MNILKEIKRPIIFGHRGACAYAPENTMASFQLAADQGADAIELDAKLSADGQVVVIHDQSVERTTNGKGAVRSLNLADLKKLDAGTSFSDKFAGEPIPTLEEVFIALGKKVYINVELTNYSSGLDVLPDKVAALVKKHKLEDWVLFSSFFILNILRIRTLLPQTPAAILTLEGKEGKILRGNVGRLAAPEIIHPYKTDATEEFIQKQHDLRRRVHVWTVNEPAEMRRLFKANVDGIFTDDPITALKIKGEG